jgi:hypothetical protein
VTHCLLFHTSEFERYSAAFGGKGYWGSASPILLGPHILSFAACGVLGFWVVLMSVHWLILWCDEHHSSLEGSTPRSGVESLVDAPLDSDLSSTLFLSRTWLMRRSLKIIFFPIVTIDLFTFRHKLIIKGRLI